MNEFDVVIIIPWFLIAIVFTNRYFFGRFLRKGREAMQSESSRTTDLQPDVAIIIPMYNEGKTIYSTIQSLLIQDYPAEKLSVWVVDDCSSDDSYEWAKKAESENSRVNVIRNEYNMGKRLGIANAVRRVETDYVVSVDSDVIVETDAISKLMCRFTSDDIAAVGGRVMVLNCNHNWLTKMQTIKYFYGYEFLKDLERTFYSVLCLSGCLTAYRRDALLELESILEKRSLFGIPIKYGEDRFLTRQLLKVGYKTRLTLDSICYTKAPENLNNYFSQQLRWRRSNLVDFLGGVTHVWKLHPAVAIHYFSLYTLLIIYPIFLWGAFITDQYYETALIHVGVLAIFGGIYVWLTRDVNEKYKVHPMNFLWMAIVMPVSYMVLTTLAIFTLDSGSWETRGSTEKPKTNDLSVEIK